MEKGIKFAEEKCETITVKNKTFVYFLLENDIVVYVGQTRRGIIRPLSHKDKIFDTIKILYCDKSELDFLEDKYISKYIPKYNKTLELSSMYSLMRARNKIRKETTVYDFSIPDLKEIIKKLNISPITRDFKYYIKIRDYEKIVYFIKGTL